MKKRITRPQPKAKVFHVGGGTCAIAEGITKEQLLGLLENLEKDTAEFAKRNGLTLEQLDAMTNEQLWERACRESA